MKNTKQMSQNAKVLMILDKNMTAFSNEGNIFNRTNVQKNVNDLALTNQIPTENQAS